MKAAQESLEKQREEIYRELHQPSNREQGATLRMDIPTPTPA